MIKVENGVVQCTGNMLDILFEFSLVCASLSEHYPKSVLDNFYNLAFNADFKKEMKK